MGSLGLILKITKYKSLNLGIIGCLEGRGLLEYFFFIQTLFYQCDTYFSYNRSFLAESKMFNIQRVVNESLDVHTEGN